MGTRNAGGNGTGSAAGNELSAAPARSAPAVVCANVVKTYGSGETAVRALRGVDFEVQAGELTLLVGPSGCGKTTLISIIAGLLEPTSGLVEVFGEDLHKMRARRKSYFRGRTVGFVFQQYNLIPALTAAENAAVPLLVAGVRRAQAVQRAALVLEQFDLGSRASALPSQLSGGQQQRVAIARALVHEPRLLVCDEPTAALDARNGQLVMELIKSVAVQPDRAVIVVSHDSRVYHFGNRIVHMADGAIEKVELQTEAA